MSESESEEESHPPPLPSATALTLDVDPVTCPALCLTAVGIFSAEKCLKLSFKNVSDFKLLGKFWCLKLDISLLTEKWT
jgi:hypothetical protein